MKASSTKPSTAQKKQNFSVYMKRYWQLYVLLFLPMLYLLIFKYVPMVYIQIAFKKYSIVESVWNMPWAGNNGFEYFIKAFNNKDFINALRNTLMLNLLDLVVGFPAPIIFALILNELVSSHSESITISQKESNFFLAWMAHDVKILTYEPMQRCSIMQPPLPVIAIPLLLFNNINNIPNIAVKDNTYFSKDIHAYGLVFPHFCHCR